MVSRQNRLALFGVLWALAGAAQAAESVKVHVVPETIFHEGKAIVPGQVVDRLEYVGAWSMAAADQRFGGLSSLAWTKDGQLAATSDKGNLVILEAKGVDFAKTASINATIAPLLDTTGKPLVHPRNDAESLAVRADGSLRIGFEREHRVDIYDMKTRLPTASLAAPREVASAMPANGGFEAMAELEDGTVFAIGEGTGRRRTFKAWLLDGKGGASQLTYRARGATPSDMVRLPDGNILVLERSIGLGGIRINLSHVNRRNIAAGSTLKPHGWLSLDGGSGLDNMEAVAVSETAPGVWRILLLSDNNFRWTLQKTLLIEWRFKGK